MKRWADIEVVSFVERTTEDKENNARYDQRAGTQDIDTILEGDGESASHVGGMDEL